MSDTACIKCKKKQNKKEKFYVFPCDSCDTLYCGECSGLSGSEVKCMILLERNLKFFCDLCNETDIREGLKKTIHDKNTIISDKELIIKMLQEKIQKLEYTHTYANIASTTTSNSQTLKAPVKNIPPVLIKPNNTQDAEITKKYLQSKINPSQLKMSINSLRTAKNGIVVIKCNNEQESQKLIKSIQEQDTENKYTVQQPQMKKPRFKIITTATNNMSTEDIANCLRKQNQFIQNEDYLKITYIKTTQNNKSTVFGECSGDLFRRLMTFKKVFIAWERCPVYEDNRIPRCKICFAYDHHKEDDCKNKKTICTYCSGEHKLQNCLKTIKKCCNCSRSNEKYKLEHPTNHEAYSIECPTYKFYLQRFKNSIDYYSM